MLAYEDLIAAHGPIEDARRSGDALAGIFYTGGTTGTPKGVMLSHANLLTSALGCTASGSFMAPGGRLLHVAPMFHLADFAAWTARTAIGGTHVDPAVVRTGCRGGAIEQHAVTEMLLVPMMIQMLVDSPAAKAADMSSVANVIYGASPISEAVLERAAAALPGAGFTQAYGMTELAPVATLLNADEHGDPKLARAAGKAAPHAEVRIVDANDQRGAARRRRRSRGTRRQRHARLLEQAR